MTPSGSSASSPSARALVAGVGAIGGWLLARLAEGGADVTGWARGETYKRLTVVRTVDALVRFVSDSVTGVVGQPSG